MFRPEHDNSRDSATGEACATSCSSNGETAVCVRVDLPGRTRRAAEIMTWYGPVKVDLAERSDEGRVLRDLQQTAPGV